MNQITLNQAQREAVNSHHPRILCLAGPGSGKTRTLIERIDRLTNDGISPSSMVVLTFTTAAAQEIQERLGAAKLGFAGTLHAYMLEIVKKHYAFLGYGSARLAVLDEEQADELLERVCKEVNYRGSKKAVLELANLGERQLSAARIAARRLTQTLRNNNLITFDDILTSGLAVLTGGLVDPVEYLFTDELQDASDIDFECYHEMRPKNWFAVGDPDQSIYSWRGGRVENILTMAQDSATKVILLEDNYRSDKAICEAANRLIVHNPARIAKETHAVSQEEGTVTVTDYQTADAEIMGAINVLRRNDGQSCAVLLRTNVLVDQWAKVISGYGVPIAKRQRTDRPADWGFARMIVAMLNDPENDWLVHQYLVTSGDKRQSADAVRLTANASCCSMNSLTLKLPLGLPLGAYSQSLARRGVSGESVALIETAIDRLPPEATGTELMAALAAGEHHGEEMGTGVHVGTYHSAKGREWDVVILAAAEQGNKTGDDLSEERRLFYVGITRARHELVISYARERKPPYGGGRPLPAEPSQFIAEAGL